MIENMHFVRHTSARHGQWQQKIVYGNLLHADCRMIQDFFFKIACLHFAVITLLLHLSLFPCLMIVGAKCNTSPLLSIFSHVECYTQLQSSLFSDVICPSYRWSSFTSCSLNCFKQNFSISSCRAYVTCCQKLLIFVQIVACWFWVICEVIIIWVISL